MDYMKFYKQITLQTTLQWMEFMRESASGYRNLLMNTASSWEQLYQISSIYLIKEMQKSLKETESIPN